MDHNSMKQTVLTVKRGSFKAAKTAKRHGFPKRTPVLVSLLLNLKFDIQNRSDHKYKL